MATNTPVEKVANVFSKLFNPLRSLTKPQIERMVTNWHHGDDVRMQMVFSEIETQSSIYQVCINKRTAGVLNRQWDILPEDDSAEARNQADAVKKVFRRADRRNEDGLTEAMKHLVMSAFRGRSAVKPFFDQDGNLFFKKLNNWNVLRYNGRFYWNPSSEEVGWFDADTPPMVTPLPDSEICYLTNDMPIDVPGLMLYLRQLVGEEQWSRFVEKQGIPQVVLNTPEGTPDTALALWNQRAMQIFEGGSGTLPYDAKVNVLDTSRGQDPFTSYIQHQMEMISILATGGTLMTIGGSTGLGSDLARVQQESFNSLVNQDCRRLANAMTDSVVSKVAHRLFPGKMLLCRFEFVEDDEYSAQDYLDMALKLNQIGVKLDAAKLKEATKLAFIQDIEEWMPKPDKGDGSWTPAEKDELRKEMEAAE